MPRLNQTRHCPNSRPKRFSNHCGPADSPPSKPKLRIAGYTEDELLGQDPHFMNGEQTEAAAIRQYETAINEGRDNTVEILQYRKDGKPFRAMLFASPLDSEGRVTHHFLSYLDITRRYDAEDELRTLTSELERRVAERTHDLEASNAKLYQPAWRLTHSGVFRPERVRLSGGEQEVRHAARDCASFGL